MTALLCRDETQIGLSAAALAAAVYFGVVALLELAMWSTAS